MHQTSSISSLSHAYVSPDSELPTYNEVARDPNSRFGRWKGWIEKRAAERYADDTPEKRLARQLKGWGPQTEYETQERPLDTSVGFAPLHRTRTGLSQSAHLETLPVITHQVDCEALPPSHATLGTFGSRFIPHSEYPILSLLPISEKRLLIGHSCGLCVLDMESEVPDLNTKEPRRYDIFYGEGYDSIHQMDILELEESTFASTPKGIVLALVGTESEGGNIKGCGKSIRMYNLAGLANLAQWACETKGKEPLELTQSTSSLSVNPEPFKRKYKLKAASVDLGNLPKYCQPSSSISSVTNMHARNSVVLDDKGIADTKKLPLRWAAEYVSIVTPGSRLENQNVLFYALQRCKERGRVVARLAVATKQSILLYETLRGERSFRFVKEFYIPASPKSITFVQQQPSLSQKTDFSKDTTRNLTAPLTSWLRFSQINSNWNYGQLSLFITFDKKACLIRVLDSSVTELEMWQELKIARRASSLSLVSGTPNPFRLSRSSFEGQILKESRLAWLPPTEISLPLFGKALSGTDMVTVYLLTREQRTHIVPAPLPVPLYIYSPLRILQWGIRPADIVARLCHRPLTEEPFLQVTALGQEGLEIQEHSLNFLDPGSKGKWLQKSLVVQADVGPGGAGFLRMGGHWNRRNKEKPLPPLPLHRSPTKSTVDSFDLRERNDREQGFYAWARKGHNDWRVFWLGGDAGDGLPPAPTML